MHHAGGKDAFACAVSKVDEETTRFGKSTIFILYEMEAFGNAFENDLSISQIILINTPLSYPFLLTFMLALFTRKFLCYLLEFYLLFFDLF